MDSQSQQFLQIAVPSPLRRRFDYLPPHGSDPNTFTPGQRFLVPFGSRKLVGVLLSVHSHTDIDPNKLKHALSCLDEKAVISAPLIELCCWASRYYHHPVGEVFANAIPSLMRQGEPAESKKHWCWKPTEAGTIVTAASFKKNARRQIEALEILQQHPDGLALPMLKTLGIKTMPLEALAQKGYAEKYLRNTTPATLNSQTLFKESPLLLNEYQQPAVHAVIKALDHEPPETKPTSSLPTTFLLNGVTGSGKTEVFLHLTAHCLQQNKQVLILVPEIGLTSQTISRFQSRFNCYVAALHSGLSERERLEHWLMAQKGDAPIIIGTRSAIFTPLARPGLIIIDEEHDLSYCQQDGFRYSARDLAIVRGSIEKIPVLLGSATPSFESIANANNGRYQQLRLQNRVSDGKLPQPKLVDIRSNPLKEGLNSASLHAIKTHLDNNNQVLIFVNRRGYAPVIICHHCGWTHQCQFCDSAMTVHQTPPHMLCHHCASTRAIPKQCPKCDQPKLQTMGFGTEKLEDFLNQEFDQYEIIRVDRDSVKGKTGWDKKLKQIHRGEAAILLGTQMLTKGHHFPNVTLVIIADGDSGLFSVDFRAPERLAQLIVQVSGRAGRGDTPGEVLIQTHQPDHPLLHSLLSQGYGPFAQQSLDERRDAQLPPYGYMAILRAQAQYKNQCMDFLTQAFECIAPLQHLHPSLESVQILEPTLAPMEKRAGRYRAQSLLLCPSRKPLHQLLSLWIPALESIKEGNRVRWHLEVDPIEIV